MSELIDSVQFVKTIVSRQRGRACAILTENYTDQERWAKNLAEKTGADYLNLLELFSNNTTLSDSVSQYTVEVFFNFLENRTEKDILVISGMEFLKATWSGISDNTRLFATQLSTWSKNPCLVFVLQYDKSLTDYNFGRRFTYQFVVDQRETLAI